MRRFKLGYYYTAGAASSSLWRLSIRWAPAGSLAPQFSRSIALGSLRTAPTPTTTLVVGVVHNRNSAGKKGAQKKDLYLGASL